VLLCLSSISGAGNCGSRWGKAMASPRKRQLLQASAASKKGTKKEQTGAGGGAPGVRHCR